MPKTLLEDLSSLSNVCFNAEKKLPMWDSTHSHPITDPEEIRRRLYRLRCEIGTIRSLVDLWKVDYGS